MTTAVMHDLREARQLLRLRTLREDAARSGLEAARRREAECQRVVARRQAQVAEVRRARVQLQGWMSGAGATSAPRTGPYAGARRMALDEELERAELELIDERNELKQARAELEQAHALWLRERARRQSAEQLAADARRAQALGREMRAERELEPLPRWAP